ncbi:MAG: Smr/MutS family protein [Deltaproteobacteria bacterium]|nr:Smr/MutS family protein [Deltaproteobacteria bacterium]
MEERALRILEFLSFLDLLKDQASSAVGRALCLSLRPAAQRAEVEERLKDSAEALCWLKEEGEISLSGLQEVRPFLSRARAEGACLSPEELLSIRETLGAARTVKTVLQAAGPRFPRLGRRGEELGEFSRLLGLLHSALDPRGEILDTASPELARLRREIVSTRGRIRRLLEGLWEEEKLEKVFQERIITLRNERYVVPLKAEFKQSLPGIIHDQSHSKATFFIEPLATVEENNELNLLLKDEKEEERRVLLSLTKEVRERTEEIARGVEILAHLDLIFAQARYGKSAGGTIPLLNEQGLIDLFQARHPLLEPQMVPIDLHLEPGRSTLILTGANAGGKTVALKTLGLLTVMAQSGIPLPAKEGSRIAVFREIFADIGDEQSLPEHLSTFSAWVLTLRRILEEAGPDSLVLLDEAGGGTDPGEGAALTMALLDTLRPRGTKTVVTTHLNLLKAYGAAHPDVVNVSVEFDAQSFRPTYRLIYGRPGESYALPMAEKGGLPRELIERAREYLGEGDRHVASLLQSLELRQRELEARLEESERALREAEAARAEAQTLLQKIREEEEEVRARARREARDLVRQAREELRLLINEFKARGRTDLHRLGQRIREEEKRLAPEEGEPPRTSRRELESFRELGQALGLKARGKEGRPAGTRVQYEVPSPSRQVKVIGLRVDEALPLVERAIDEAFLGGLREVEVIHGAGTGRLRRAIRQLLEDHPLVQGFHSGEPGRGGDVLTVVEIGPAGAGR